MKLKELVESHASHEAFIAATNFNLRRLCRANPEFVYDAGNSPCFYHQGPRQNPESCSGCLFGQTWQSMGWSDASELCLVTSVSGLFAQLHGGFNHPAYWSLMQTRQDNNETWGTLQYLLPNQLVIVRGISGSGKTSFIEQNMPDCSHFGADLEFEKEATAQGKTYSDIWDARLLPIMHSRSMANVLRALQIKEPWIAVDNTHTQRWEYENYMLAGQLAGYEVHVHEVPWVESDAEVYSARNKHGVPVDVIKNQMKRWEAA